MTKQPKITVDKEQIDHILTYVAFGILAFMILATVMHYPQLPDQIPIHFNAAGDPDSYGDKKMIMILPILSIIMVLGLNMLSKIPHTYNYLVSITEENAHDQYQKASRMMRAINAIIAGMFSYILWASIQVALGNWTGLGSTFLILSMLILFGTIFYFILESIKQSP